MDDGTCVAGRARRAARTGGVAGNRLYNRRPMNIRTLTRALGAVVCLASVGTAGAQGFVSVSSMPAPPVESAPAPAGPTTVASPATATTTSVSVPRSPPAFSSVSSAGDTGPGASGSGPLLPAATSSVVMADRILVEKGARRLYLLNRGRVIAEYPVKLGLSPKGHKQYEGDFRTPEGVYHLSRRNPRSEYYLWVEVSYPNEVDRVRAEQEGLRPGGLIMIHGQPNSPRRPLDYYAKNDWTDGCIAVSNAHMRDIWLRTEVGIPIEIRP
jgi:hypothetical protein